MLGRIGCVLLAGFLAGPSTAAPMGLAMGLAPMVAVPTVTAGGVAAFLVSLFAMDFIKARWPRKPRERSSKTRDRAHRLLLRVGPVGFGLLGPALVGTWVAAVAGAALGLARWRLLVWLIAGVTVWTVILVLASDALLSWLF
jgi:sterol desaturase/sphingolipid hydroxylase (fatty acid hydroxylase superfamily)